MRAEHSRSGGVRSPLRFLLIALIGLCYALYLGTLVCLLCRSQLTTLACATLLVRFWLTFVASIGGSCRMGFKPAVCFPELALVRLPRSDVCLTRLTRGLAYHAEPEF